MGYAWGADRSALKAIYCGLIRSILDYGAGTSLRKLDIIQYQALRLCTGAFKTTPTAVLQVEMGEMPLDMRRLQLSLVYWVNLQGHVTDHPTKCTLESCWEKGKRDSKSFGWTTTQETEEIEIARLDVSQTVPLFVCLMY